MYHLASLAQYKVALRKPVIILVTLLFVMALMQFDLVSTARADQPDVAVNIIPNSVDIPSNPQNQVQVEVEVSSLSNITLQDIQLCWFTNAAVTVTNSLPSKNCLPSLNTLAPSAQYIWDVELSSTKDRLVPGSVQFRINYKRPATGQAGLIDRVSFASLMVQGLKPQAVQQVANVQVITSLTTLNEQQPGQVYLLITNASDFQLQINRLILKGPDFISLNARGFTEANHSKSQANNCNNMANEVRNEVATNPLFIAPRQAITIAIDVSTSCPVQPGKQLLVFEIEIGWQDVGQVQTGNLVASQEVQVGVLGSSEILTLLGIPSFLFLPGFLVLITVRLLWQLSTKKPSEDYPLKTISPEFGLVAIILSGIAAFVYPLITGRNYLVRYDLTDIVNIWLASVGLAILGYFVVAGSFNLWTRYRIWYMQQRTPSENDLPIAVLYKLDKQGLGIQRNYLDLNVEGESPHAYLLQRDDGQEKLWVGPTIVVKWKDGASQKDQDEVNRCIKKGNAKRNARALADLLHQKDHIVWEVSWRPLKIHNKPFPVQREEIANFSSLQSIVETES